ncbi:hypothetical protein JEQ12_013205 [Ovis aries]|uniref:Uncharacterized protein n=1 Tax=Ovis aries TaxID=9940 RepID=A0A836CR15_SHEEP|nr:hypothetical protein JEQ12_013205 [Ovis aries]
MEAAVFLVSRTLTLVHTTRLLWVQPRLQGYRCSFSDQERYKLIEAGSCEGKISAFNEYREIHSNVSQAFFVIRKRQVVLHLGSLRSSSSGTTSFIWLCRYLAHQSQLLFFYVTVVTHYVISDFRRQNENSSVENETELEKSTVSLQRVSPVLY